MSDIVIDRHGQHIAHKGRPGQAGGSEPGYYHVPGTIPSRLDYWTGPLSLPLPADRARFEGAVKDALRVFQQVIGYGPEVMIVMDDAAQWGKGIARVYGVDETKGGQLGNWTAYNANGAYDSKTDTFFMRSNHRADWVTSPDFAQTVWHELAHWATTEGGLTGRLSRIVGGPLFDVPEWYIGAYQQSFGKPPASAWRLHEKEYAADLMEGYLSYVTKTGPDLGWPGFRRWNTPFTMGDVNNTLKILDAVRYWAEWEGERKANAPEIKPLTRSEPIYLVGVPALGEIVELYAHEVEEMPISWTVLLGPEAEPEIIGMMRRVVTRHGKHIGHEGRPGESGGSQPGYTHEPGSIPSGGKGETAPPAGGLAPAEVAVGAALSDENIKIVDDPNASSLLDRPVQRVSNGVFGVSFCEDQWLALAQDVIARQPPETLEAMRSAEERLKQGKTTAELYRDPATGQWREDRARMHAEIIAGLLEGVQPQDEPELLITGGLPGSGKSTVLKARGGGAEGVVHVDADAIRAMFPEYEGWNAGLLQIEAEAVVEETVRRAVEARLPITYDASLKGNSGLEILSMFEANGYKTNVVYVDVPMEMAMERAIGRFGNGTGRYVSPYYLATHDSRNVGNLEKIKGIADGWEHWDNSQALGMTPTLLAKGARR